jgi:hypothetical protein
VLLRRWDIFPTFMKTICMVDRRPNGVSRRRELLPADGLIYSQSCIQGVWVLPAQDSRAFGDRG